MKLKKRAAVTVAVLFAMACPQMAFADEIFKSSKFLTWKRASQEFYIQTSIGIAGMIAGQNDKVQEKCLEDWYVKNEKGATDFILSTMARFPDYHPRGVILAALEKKCGKFIYK